MSYHLMTRTQLHDELEKLEEEREGLSCRYNANQISSIEDKRRSILNCLNNMK